MMENDRQFLHSKLDPGLSNVVMQLLNDGHYDNAVLEAYKFIETRLNEYIGTAGEFGTQLIAKCFDPNTGILTDYGLPLKEREGFLLLAKGAHQFIRNPRGHRRMAASFEEALDFVLLANLILKQAEAFDRKYRHVQPNANGTPVFRYGRDRNPLSLDVDNDGSAELVIPGDHKEEFLRVQRLNGDEYVDIPVEQPAPGSFWFFSDAALVDFDGDGLNELVCFCEGATQGAALLIYRYVGGRQRLIHRPSDLPAELPGPTEWFDTATIRDFDGDGQLEVISAPMVFVPDELWPSDTPLPTTEEERTTGRVRYTWRWNSTDQKLDLLKREFVSFYQWPRDLL